MVIPTSWQSVLIKLSLQAYSYLRECGEKSLFMWLIPVGLRTFTRTKMLKLLLATLHVAHFIMAVEVADNSQDQISLLLWIHWSWQLTQTMTENPKPMQRTSSAKLCRYQQKHLSAPPLMVIQLKSEVVKHGSLSPAGHIQSSPTDDTPYSCTCSFSSFNQATMRIHNIFKPKFCLHSHSGLSSMCAGMREEDDFISMQICPFGFLSVL